MRSLWSILVSQQCIEAEKERKKYPIRVWGVFYYVLLWFFFLRNTQFYYHLDIRWVILVEEVMMIARHADKCLCTACFYRKAGKQEEDKGHFTDFLASNLWWVWYEQDTRWNTITKYYYLNMISSTIFCLHYSIIYPFSYFCSDEFRPACPTSPLSVRIAFDFKPRILKSQKCRTENVDTQSLWIPVSGLEV